MAQNVPFQLSKPRVRSGEQTLRLEAPGTPRPPCFLHRQSSGVRGARGTVSGDCRPRPRATAGPREVSALPGHRLSLCTWGQYLSVRYRLCEDPSVTYGKHLQQGPDSIRKGRHSSTTHVRHFPYKSHSFPSFPPHKGSTPTSSLQSSVGHTHRHIDSSEGLGASAEAPGRATRSP